MEQLRKGMAEPARLLLTLILLWGGLAGTAVHGQTYHVNVGETFTVYATRKSYTQSVMWNYDWKVVEPVGYIGATTTSVTFRAIAPSPSVGSIIQAVTYYFRNGTTSSGLNRQVEDWRVIVEDNSTVSLNYSSMTMSPGDRKSLSARVSSSSYSGDYTWSSSSPSVAYVSGWGSSVSIVAQNSGSTTISVELDNGNRAQCNVTVRAVDVSSASVSPSYMHLDIDETSSLFLSVQPSYATVNSRSWKSKDPGVASVSSSGTVRGVSEGTTEIYCIVNGAVTSNSCEVTVSKPSFTLSSSSPSDNATGQSVFVRPTLTFCRQLYEGTAFADVVLKERGGTSVEGTVSISGRDLTFAPSEPLEPYTSYTFFVPHAAVKDKYGTANTGMARTFTTGGLEKLVVEASTTERFLSRGEKISLTANGSGATIYYTLDGSTPTDKSTKYQGAITLNEDLKLRAIAMGDGYESSDIFSHDYYISNVDVVRRFPDADTRMFEYKDVNPYITFSNGIEESVNVESVKLEKNGTEAVAGDVVVADSSIFFIPEQPLEMGCRYQMSIPEGAVRTLQGEDNDSTSWSFGTGDYATAIAMGASELAAAIKTDGSLLTWGNRYQSGDAADGSYTMTPLLWPDTFMTGKVRTVSSGYMHHAIIKDDSSLWMWGRQYCGEFGNNSTAGSANPVKVMDEVSDVSCGGQTTAILKTDASLWMCGRNDFGQIGDSSVVNRNEPVKILEDVSLAVAGWCTSYAVKTDGSLWAWGRNDKHQLGIDTDGEQLIPVKVMDDVAIVAASATESDWVAVIKTDGTLWAWGKTQPSPTKMLDDVSSVVVGADYVEAVKDDGTLWAFGDNAFGQLGNGTTSTSASPVKIMDDVAHIASGGQTTMANMQDGSVWTWGRNDSGLLGDGTAPSLTACRSTPVQVIEGRGSSLLAGITARKNTYRLVEGNVNVIDAKPVPLDAVYTDLSWSSMDDDIVTVTERGVIQAESLGETDVVAVIRNGNDAEYTMTCHVVVTDVTGVSDAVAENHQIKIWAKNSQLHVAGLRIGQNVSVYATNGLLLYKGVADADMISINLNYQGVCVVRVDDYSRKILMR